MFVYGIVLFFILIIALALFLYIFERKLLQLEYKIRRSFRFRTALIPSLFESTQEVFHKHDLIFTHILWLRIEEMLGNTNTTDLHELVYLESKIHRELNFIFKVSHKHHKLQKDPRFVYVRDLFVESSYKIWKDLQLYQAMIQIYNRYVVYKNASIIGYCIPAYTKVSI